MFGDLAFDSSVDITADNEWLIEAFMEQAEENGKAFKNPDGTEFDPSQAVRASGNKEGVNALFFDYAYILYTSPNSYTFAGEEEYNKYLDSGADIPKESDFIKVKAGDVLENGLVVKEASTSRSNSAETLDYAASTSVRFEGELTLEGDMIYCPAERHPLGYDVDYFTFEPDLTKATLPKIMPGLGCRITKDEAGNDLYTVAEFLVIELANGEEAEISAKLKALFAEDEYSARVKVTLKDPSCSYSDGPGYKFSGTPVSVEKIG